jgi:phage tail-like protein
MFLINKVFREALAVNRGSGLKFANTNRFDPYKSFKFEVVISGQMVFAKAGFQKVSGLKMSTEVTEYREGGDNNTTSKIPGITKFDPITLERGMSEDVDMYNWAMKMFSIDGDKGTVASPNYRAQMEITLKDRNGTPVKRWQIPSCWVSKYETGDFDAMGNNIMIEKIEVVHEGFKKILG